MDNLTKKKRTAAGFPKEARAVRQPKTEYSENRCYALQRDVLHESFHSLVARQSQLII